MSNSKTILVTGANGQLGSEVKAISVNYTNYNFLFVGKDDLLIDDYIAVENFFQNNNIDICINCAAYTAVDKAESEPEKAFAINAHGASNLATQCQYYNAQLIHISTDYVFNGNATQPIKEDEPTNPIGIYGVSKLKGEELVRQVNPSAIIIRTSWVYSSFGNNFVKTMIRLMNERESISVVNDQIGKPTYARDLAEAILKLVVAHPILDIKSSILHYSNSGNPISWYDFAIAINKKINSKCVVNAIPTSSYPTPAKRPVYSVLDTTKIEKELDITIANWEDGLERCLTLLNR
ncbi:MAG: dTDP-4-dehydrorhamnose reductase [Ferruginibacter sp.]|nr:dTDP-4-dehydrorhamnose reductase [Ferruginibacter sp.]